MHRRLFLAAIALSAGIAFVPKPALANSSSSSGLKVLARQEGGFNVSAVQNLIKKGDKSASNGNLQQAKKHYDKARDVSKQLLAFYRDLGGSFRGLDARIPREMNSKGRETRELLAKINLRLAALFRRQNQPEIAVPVLIEVVRVMTPASPMGQKAYQNLIDLGFVETPYGATN